MRGVIFKLMPLLFLAGCASTQPGIRTVMVDRPVVQVEHCVNKEDVPARPASLNTGPAPSDLEQALSVALAKISEWTRYGNRTDEILRACVE
jgi:hypothetical protein